MTAAESADLRPDVDAIQAWADWWFHSCLKGEIQIGWRDAETGQITRFRTFPIGDPDIGEFVAGVNAVPGQSCYFRAATVREGLGGKAAADEDFVSAPGIWGDLDDQHSFRRGDKVEPLIRPSAWIETGRVPHLRAQCFWRLDGPCEDPAATEDLNRRIAVLYSSDTSVTNVSRLMRLPGTIAWPSKPGRVPELTKQILQPGRSDAYCVELLLAKMPREAAQQEQAAGAAEGKDWRTADLGNCVAAKIKRALACDHWHDNVRDLTAHWIGRGFSDVEILAMAPSFTLPGFTVQQTRREMAVMIRGAREKWGVQDHDHFVGDEGGPAAAFKGMPYDPWNALRPVDFPLDALPDVLRDFAAVTSRAVGCDPAGVAMASLSALSVAMGGKWKLRMKRHDRWEVPPALWVLLIGGSASKKSPAMRAAWSHLKRVQGRMLQQWLTQVKEWEAAPKDMREPRPPQQPRRFVSDDSSMEAMQDILSRQDQGCGMMADELAGWLGVMEKYGGGGRGAGADRAFWLRSFDGGEVVVDRVGRGTVSSNNLLTSVCGGIQPDSLAGFRDIAHDGLLQRFLPVLMRPGELDRDVPSGPEEDAYSALLDRAIRQDPHVLTLGEMAQRERDTVASRIFQLEKGEALGPHFSSFVGKLQGIWGRLALVLGCADGDLGFMETGGGKPSYISEAAAKRATRLIFEYILPMAARVYSSLSIGRGDIDTARDIAGFILAKRLNRIVASDLSRNVRSTRRASLEDVQKAVSPLVAGGWLAPEKPHAGNNSWSVNPLVHTVFAERIAQETERRKQVAELTKDGPGEHHAPEGDE